ncbi:MAG: hypothetical protein HYY25_07675 [Candidatus Wallbacteria bacterium]|nr:hypothetical protein [Candidatus Wallbacteria bacterium]
MKIVAWLTTLLLAAPAGAMAWDGHDRLTRLALADVAWLDSLPPVLVTTRTDRVSEIRQDYAFPYKGERQGDHLTARSILERYAMEPDDGPDQELRVSWQQRFMGGYTGMSSRGYFHMYYPSWTVHFPLPATAMGAAPERAALWCEAAKAALARGDTYWGLRYLACAMHYVEDLGQPYHATQTSTRFVVPTSPIAGTTKVTSNYHLAYEAWIARRVAEDTLELGQTLRGIDLEKFDDPGDAVRRVARKAHEQSGRLFGACIEFFGDRFHQPVDVPATEADLARMEPAGPRDRMIAATRPALALTARAIRGFLEPLRPAIQFSVLEGARRPRP